jgi:hypothetical protein
MRFVQHEKHSMNGNLVYAAPEKFEFTIVIFLDVLMKA